MSEKVIDLINEIKSGLSQTSSSRKDEVRIMKVMLSDPTFEVTTYGKDGPDGTYNPCKDFRSMCSSVIASTAKIPQAEAESLMMDYEPKKSEATAMVGIAKEFVSTYVQTGRKLPLGGRETSNVSVSAKHVAEQTRPYPQKVGVNEDGSDRFSRSPTTVPAHDSIRVYGPCPSWIRK